MTLQTLASNYQEEFRSFAAEQRSGAIPSRPVVFYGSSSIRLWSSLARDFAGLPVVNRGFGGSTLEECVSLLDELVTPVKPRAIVLYAGDNDLDQGASPETVLARFEQFAGAVRMRLGWTPIAFVSIKPSPARFWNAVKIEKTNALIEQAISLRWREAQYVDIFQATLDPYGSPRTDLFTEDGLHMNSAGYALWRGAIGKALAETGLQSESRVP